MSEDEAQLTHLDAAGNARMVDVGDKAVTDRRAIARCIVAMAPATADAVAAGDAPKGDVVGTARLAGIMAAKRTADLIPLCHPLALSMVDVTITIDRTPAESLPPMGPLSVRYRGELSDPANLRGEGTDAELVYGGGGIDPSVIVPVGTLVWEQKRVPLDLPLQRAEGQDLGGVRTLRVSVAGVADPDLGAEHDSFARGTFAHLSDAEALATPSFVEARSGFRLDGAAHMQAAAAVERRIELNLVRLPERRRIAFAGLIAALPLIELGLLSESLQGAAVRPQAPAVTVGSEAWQHVDASGAVTGGSAAACLMTAKLSGGMATPAGTAAVELQEVLG